MTPSKPKKGQVLYKVCVQHLYGSERKNGKYEYYGVPVTVVKVGREYFYTAREGRESEECKHRWDRDSFDSYAAGRTNLYESWAHYFETKERERLMELIRKNVDGYGTVKLSYQQLRAVADILEIR